MVCCQFRHGIGAVDGPYVKVVNPNIGTYCEVEVGVPDELPTASATQMAQMDYELPTASAASVSNPALVPPASTLESSENQYAEVVYSEVAEPVEDVYEDIAAQTFQEVTLERKM